jgi:hypothetical protein
MYLYALLVFATIELTASDTPNDDGSSITITWQAEGIFKIFQLYRSTDPAAGFEKIGEVSGDRFRFFDTDIRTDQKYFYQLKAVGIDTNIVSPVIGPVKGTAQVFNMGRLNVAVCIALLFAGIIYYIRRARRGEILYIRKIPAINAIEEAIGRATEMGKPVLYVPGIMDIDEPETIASMSILGRVAEKTAAYGTPLYVPTCHAMTMSMVQQIVKESATRVGRPDWFNADNIRYLTDDQFAYVSAVDGIMVREKTATNFYLGKFYAESLILAETGHVTGAIQIAGTALPDQLPFFVAACDFTLLGEELYAASAYLSQEPVQLGSLKGQDFGKLIFITVIIIGVVLRLFGVGFFSNIFTAQ